MYCHVIVDIANDHVAKPFTYAVPEGMVLQSGQRVLVPFGSREKEGIVLSFSEETDLPKEKIRSVIRQLEDYVAVPPELIALAEEMAEKAHCPLAETLRLMIPAQMRGGRIHEKTEKWVKLLAGFETVEKEIAAVKKRGKRQAILEMLLEESPRTVKEIENLVKDPREALKKLEADGMIVLFQQEQLRIPASAFQTVPDPGYQLTDYQKEVLEEILPCLTGKGGLFLLHGVTGSGKTEVFMKAVQETLAGGKSAMILVPEIALTPQMVSWFRGRFGTAAAVIHSRLSPGERYDEWRRILRGDARVVIGARSAVFAPVRRLGLIVVDEEHESTYLNDRHPRYDTREIAVSRCRRENATLILASATPSILSFAKARRGDYMLLEMPRRVQNRPLPEVEVVDMRQELETGNRTVFSRMLRKAMKNCMDQGEQAILLMNRRGYHSFVSCRSCGYVVKCTNCDISMTCHLNDVKQVLRCHYCGKTMIPPERCPECGSRYIRFFGAGTQKVEEEVHSMLPGVSTIRMDYDTTGGKDGHGAILETFRSGKARILIGTQMIAKGLDFPGVTLVGIVAADQVLNYPDYRNRERAFQLFTQVAGRAGRGSIPGKVILQTYKPEDPVIGFAVRQDYRAFFESEFRRRRTGLYPPFTAIVRILIESAAEEKADRALERAEEQVHGILRDHPRWEQNVLTFSRELPSVQRLKGKNRRQILMKVKNGADTDEFLGALTEMTAGDQDGADLFLEVNPTTMI